MASSLWPCPDVTPWVHFICLLSRIYRLSSQFLAAPSELPTTQGRLVSSGPQWSLLFPVFLKEEQAIALSIQPLLSLFVLSNDSSFSIFLSDRCDFHKDFCSLTSYSITKQIHCFQHVSSRGPPLSNFLWEERP